EPVDGRTRSVGDGQARARQREVRRAAGPVPPQQRGSLLRELRRVRGDHARHRYDAEPAGGARQQRPRLLRAPLLVAGDREEVRRYASAAVEGIGAAADGTIARMVRAAAAIATAGGFNREATACWTVSGGADCE